MVELTYFETDYKKLHLRKTILKFMNLIFGKKLMLKHFMRRIIPKRCVQEYFEPPSTFLRSILHEKGSFLGQLYTYCEICKNGHKIQKNEVYRKVFHATFFAFRTPFFIFLVSRQGRHSYKKSKDFVVYFFCGSNKT